MKLMEIVTTAGLSGDEIPKRLNVDGSSVMRRNMDILKKAIIKFEEEEKKKKRKKKKEEVILFKEEEEENYQKAIDYIKSNYNQQRMAEILDDSIVSVAQDQWREGEEGFGNDEHQWYDEYGRGEAPEYALEYVMGEASKKLKLSLSYNDESKIEKWAKEYYKVL